LVLVEVTWLRQLLFLRYCIDEGSPRIEFIQELIKGNNNNQAMMSGPQEGGAVLATSLLALDLEEAASETPSVSDPMGGSQHLARTGKELHFHPEAQALVASKAVELKERAKAARPLALQVASLEASFSAKVAETERLSQSSPIRRQN